VLSKRRKKTHFWTPVITPRSSPKLSHQIDNYSYFCSDASISKRWQTQRNTHGGASMHTEHTSNTVNPAADVPTDQPDTNTTPGTNQTNTTISTPVSPTATPATPTEPQHIQDLRTAFSLAIASAEFTDDSKKVKKAIEALKLPNPETRVRAQLRSNTEKTLYAAAAKRATNSGNPFVAPTQADIDAQVERGVQAWRDKNGR
jgi:hypothetical protein